MFLFLWDHGVSASFSNKDMKLWKQQLALYIFNQIYCFVRLTFNVSTYCNLRRNINMMMMIIIMMIIIMMIIIMMMMIMMRRRRMNEDEWGWIMMIDDYWWFRICEINHLRKDAEPRDTWIIGTLAKHWKMVLSKNDGYETVFLMVSLLEDKGVWHMYK